MISINDAIKCLYEKFPNKRIVSCIDTGDFYAFRLVERSLKIKGILDIPVGSGMEAVQKSTGELFFISPLDIDNTAHIFAVNVIPFLSKDDADFYKLFNDIIKEGKQ